MARRKSADASEETATVEQGAATRLRAFEDEKFGPDTPRHDGKVERGSGSPYSMLDDADRAMHAKLERCVAAEEKLAAAHAALSQAEADVLAAEAEANAISE